MFIHCGGKTHFETIVDLFNFSTSARKKCFQELRQLNHDFQTQKKVPLSRRHVQFFFRCSCFSSTFLLLWGYIRIVLLIADSTPFETLQSKMDELEKKQDPQGRILLSRLVTNSPSLKEHFLWVNRMANTLVILSELILVKGASPEIKRT